MKEIIKAHRFFVRETPDYIGEHSITEGDWADYGIVKTFSLVRPYVSFRQRLYYPIAYLKFMFYTIFNR